ncbi:hypothetical protein Ae406Ps2_6407 [Pseudonocardia sp. Ae406_Ps2]|nr:hypothetical protein Ae406Ps2_6407 [Pseudonocardia sp. Ae406_Ps2]
MLLAPHLHNPRSRAHLSRTPRSARVSPTPPPPHTGTRPAHLPAPTCRPAASDPTSRRRHHRPPTTPSSRAHRAGPDGPGVFSEKTHNLIRRRLAPTTARSTDPRSTTQTTGPMHHLMTSGAGAADAIARGKRTASPRTAPRPPAAERGPRRGRLRRSKL